MLYPWEFLALPFSLIFPDPDNNLDKDARLVYTFDLPPATTFANPLLRPGVCMHQSLFFLVLLSGFVSSVPHRAGRNFVMHTAGYETATGKLQEFQRRTVPLIKKMVQ